MNRCGMGGGGNQVGSDHLIINNILSVLVVVLLAFCDPSLVGFLKVEASLMRWFCCSSVILLSPGPGFHWGGFPFRTSSNEMVVVGLSGELGVWAPSSRFSVELFLLCSYTSLYLAVAVSGS